jgi:8-oxo-dGTP pyrophosphatase MutT (NUDIX family)
MRAPHDVEPQRRDSARVLLLDADGRVLLIEIFDDHDDRPAFWLTPGGRIEVGETPASAAARELLEETGVAASAEQLGDPIAVSQGEWRFRSTPLVSTDWFFVHAAPRVEVRDDRWTPLERTLLRGWRWWTDTELESTREVVVPGGLAGLVRRLASGWRPDDGPVQLPWVAA